MKCKPLMTMNAMEIIHLIRMHSVVSTIEVDIWTYLIPPMMWNPIDSIISSPFMIENLAFLYNGRYTSAAL